MVDFITVCQMMSDRTRLQLLFSLAIEPKNVTKLCKELKLRQPTISHHLGLLKALQLVVATRKGKEVYYAHAHSVVSSATKKKGIGLEVRCVEGTISLINNP